MRFIKSKTFIISIIILAILSVRHICNRQDYFFVPNYDFEDISGILDKNNLSDSDYDKIFKMTGLSRAGVNDFIANKRKDDVVKLNSLYFEKNDYKRSYIFFPTTAEDIFLRTPSPIAPLKNGDILITFSTHTLDWRHGHCAIVTDAKKGQVLEHMSIGNTSTFNHVSKWGRYTNFVILRHPDSNLAQKASEYAKENLYGIDYNLFAGLIKKDKSDEFPVSSSHCSHIVWQAYKAQGVDIDSNGGIIVTPKDISLSDDLCLIQIFGIESDDYIDRLIK